MGLKYEIDSLDGVEESVKNLYQEVDGKFRLGVEGLPEQEDISGIKRKNEELLREKEIEAEKRRLAEEQAEKIRIEAAKKNGDVDAIAKSWEDKFNNEISKREQSIQEYKEIITKSTSGAQVSKIASKLAAVVNGVSMAPHLERALSSRVTTEFIDGQAVPVVLDVNGKRSAQTLAELETEIMSDPTFAPLIVGSRASGAGHQGTGRSGGATNKVMTRENFESLSVSEKHSFMRDGGKITD